MINSKRALSFLALTSLCISVGTVADTALAASVRSSEANHTSMRPALVGTVASAPDASGTFTVTMHRRERDETSASTTPTPTTTYTVTTTSTTVVTRNGATSSVNALAVGDTVQIVGTIRGTSIAATTIHHGAMNGAPQFRGREKMGMSTSTQQSEKERMHLGTTTKAFRDGSGEPVIGGTLTAINGATLTVTNASITYTVDASSAALTKAGTTSATLANLSIGDAVVIQGTVNGTAVKATSITARATPQATVTSASTTPATPRRGFLGSLGGFFSHLFGF